MNKHTKKTAKRTTRSTKPDPNRYPKGWNRNRVESVIAHYENQTEEQATAEDEAAYESTTSAMIQVPMSLVPQVQRLIARRAG